MATNDRSNLDMTSFAIGLARRAYSKMDSMPGGPERDELINLTEPTFTAAMTHLRNLSADFADHEVESINKLAEALGEDA